MSRLEVKIWRTLRAKGLAPIRRVAVGGFGDKYHRAA
jgi:hypothetical protein